MAKKKKEKSVYINGNKTDYVITEDGDLIHVWTTKRKKLKHYVDKDGYHQFVLHYKGKEYLRRKHRLVAEAFIKNPKNLPEVNHKDGNKDHNHYSNLEWVTTKENIHHAWDTGLSSAKKGEEHPNSVYTDKQIHKVCKLIEKGELTYKEIAAKTDVSYTVVKQIKNKVIWTDISDKYEFPEYVKSSKRNISDETVHKICKMLVKGKSATKIAEKLGVKYHTVLGIKNRKNYKHIANKYDF